MATVRFAGTIGASVAAGQTRYNALGMGALGNGSTTTESLAQHNWQVAGTLSKLWVYVAANTLSSTHTVRVRKNTANGNQVITIGAGVTAAAEDASNTDTVAGGDLISLSAVAAAGTGSITIRIAAFTWAATADTSTQFVTSQGGSGRTFSAASTANYIGVTHGINTGETEATRNTRFRAAGTLRYLTIVVGSNARTTDTTFRSRKNGAYGNSTLTIAASGGTGLSQDTSNTDSIAVDDEACYELLTGTGAGNLVVSLCGSTWISTASKAYYVAGTSLSAAAGTTYYQPLAGQISTVYTVEAEGAHKLGVTPVTLSNLSVYISANAASGAGTVRSRITAANGNQTFSVGAGATGYIEDASNTDVISTATDTLSVSIVGGTGGTTTYQGQAMLASYVSTYTLSPAGAIAPSGLLFRSTSATKVGALTPAGVLARAANKPLAGALTPAGLVARSTAARLAGALTPAGGLLRAAWIGLAGALAPAGALTALKATLRTFAGALTPAGVLARSTAKRLAGALAPVGLVGRAIGRTFAGAVTLAGSLVAVLAGAVAAVFGGKYAAQHAAARAGVAAAEAASYASQHASARSAVDAAGG